MTASVRGVSTDIIALGACETRFAQTFSARHGKHVRGYPELADVTTMLILNNAAELRMINKSISSVTSAEPGKASYFQ